MEKTREEAQQFTLLTVLLPIHRLFSVIFTMNPKIGELKGAAPCGADTLQKRFTDWS
jgi:hypothetical protein